MIGDGYAVLLEGSEVLSPVSGKIVNVQDSLHAYGIIIILITNMDEISSLKCNYGNAEACKTAALEYVK